MSAPAPTAGPPRVLVVDDDGDIREALASTLADCGYLVDLAENGAQALEVLRAPGRLPRVILLDLMMPVMDGIQFRKVQLSEPALAQVPVVVLSGKGQIASSAAELGIDAFCEKPIHLDELLAVLARFAPLASPSW
jgi:CheY-like chemotaxis protein